MGYGAARQFDKVTSLNARGALKLGQCNIRVNAVNPIVVMTPMSAWHWGRPDIGPPFLKKMPLGRWATEGDAASMITGVSLSIDGGYTCV